MQQRVCDLIKMNPPVLGDSGLLFDSGDTVPTDGSSGYQTGCIFQHTDGTTGTALYLNEGSNTSCDFNAVAAITATQEALLGATAGTVTASKAVIVDANKDIGSFRNVTLAGKLNLGLNGGAVSASGVLLGVGTTASPATSSTAGVIFAELRCKTTATSGDNRLAYLRYNIAGAGASGECIRAFTDLTAAVDTVNGAHISLQAGDTGYVSGQGLAIRGQLYVKDAAVPANGTYAATQSEIYFEGSSSDIGAVTSVTLHRFIVSGDATNAGDIKKLFLVDATANNTGNKAAQLLICNADVTGGGGASAGGLQIDVEGTSYWIPTYTL